MLVTTLEAPKELYAAGSQGDVRELLAPISVDTLSNVGMTVLPTFIVYGVTPEKGPSGLRPRCSGSRRISCWS